MGRRLCTDKSDFAVPHEHISLHDISHSLYTFFAYMASKKYLVLPGLNKVAQQLERGLVFKCLVLK